ncbi:MAG: SDR family NAD(P)-dependent oxidoreductase [Pseudomonadota bacterium]|jgi:NAD(P)-dependent dehydrogenase (short-subunit alcohol dehydrogenase family)
MAADRTGMAIAIVIGASGGIGNALAEMAEGSGRFQQVVRLSRRGEPRIDIEDEQTIRQAASHVANLGVPTLVIDATGFLHGDGFEPEKTWRSLDPTHLAKSFAVNATGPALLMKHFLPLLPKGERAVFATLSAKVGSIGDNRLGGWYGYRAAKAALNQFVRTAAIELARSNPGAICVALHPGTVDTKLSAPFGKAGLAVQAPRDAAAAILSCLDKLTPRDSGGFFDRTGDRLPW